MSSPTIFYNLGKITVWLWYRLIKKKKFKYKDMIFQYPGWLFWVIGLGIGVLIIVCGYFLLIRLEIFVSVLSDKSSQAFSHIQQTELRK